MARLAKFDAILGLPWLKRINPQIDFSRTTVQLRPEQVDYIIGAGTASREIKDPELPPEYADFVARLDNFVAQRKNYLVGASTIENKAPGQELPPDYADFAELFDKKAENMLPRHEEWNHTIPLEEGKSPPYGPIYSFTPTEREILRKELY